MKLSIIIPVYNSERYLHRALDSLCAQIVEGIEIIIIDDGSTDESAQICDQYAQTFGNIRVEHTLNNGVSAARNRGLQLARGEIITFVDSDDWVEPDYCHVVIRDMSGVDMLVYNACTHHNDEVIPTFFAHNGIYTNDLDIGDAMSEIHYPENRLGWPWNKAFRKSIIDENHLMFPEGVSLFEDEVYVLQYCSHIRSLRISPNMLYHYCINANSLSFQNADRDTYSKVADYIDALSEMFTQPRFLSGLYWQVMWLKLKAYKQGGKLSYQQFKGINQYYKSRLPIIRICPAKTMHTIFGHPDLVSFSAYFLVHMIHKI